MVRRIIGIFIIIVNFALVTAKASDIINFQEFEQYIVQAMDQWHTPGAAVIVVKGDKVVYVKAFGVKAVGEKEVVTPETIFPIVSLSKPLTSALVAILVEQGKLKWDDHVVDYLPDFQLADEEVTKAFTIRDLLSHRSGLPGFAADSLFDSGWENEEVYKVLKLIPLKHKFRDNFDYQNVFPGIAGKVIEKVTGMSLSQAYTTYLFAPLAMKQTNIGKNGVTANDGWWTRLKAKIKGYFSNTVKQHHQIGDNAVIIPDGNPSVYTLESSRGINTSIQDMGRWLIFQINAGAGQDQQLLAPASFTEMRTPHVNVGPPQGGRQFPVDRVPDIDYGLGWFIHTYDRLKMITHMGGLAGVRSLIAIAPDEKVGIVVLTNLGGMRVSFMPEAIRSKFFDMYLKLADQRDWSTEIKQEFDKSRLKNVKERVAYRLSQPASAQDLKRYVGSFENELYGRIGITLENNHLVLNYRQAKVKLEHWNGDIFSFVPYEFSRSYSGLDYGVVQFVFDRSGKISDVSVNLLYEGTDPSFKPAKG